MPHSDEAYRSVSREHLPEVSVPTSNSEGECFPDPEQSIKHVDVGVSSCILFANDHWP